MSLVRLLFIALAAIVLLPTSAQAHVSTVVITMTENGFEPREITVDKHTTINFANKDKVDRWPASNVHPTHDLYPQFDPTQPIKPGGFWLFKADQVGTWKYHDHLLPHMRGTITVVAEAGNVAEPEPAASPPPVGGWHSKIKQAWQSFWHLLTRPFHLTPREAAFTPLDAAAFQPLAEADQYQYLTQLTEHQGLSITWDFVKSTYTNQGGAALGGRAHDLAHFVGEHIYEEKGLAGLSLCDTTFAFGCYHGFTESAFATSLDPLPDVATSCATLGPVNSGPWSSCIHGIGHGVATFFDAVELENALATCDQITGATFCHDGVFMEFSFSAPPSFYKASDPLYPCSALPDTYQLACGRNQPSVMRGRLNLSEADIAARCSESSPTFR
ncbi:MAG TPA: cupredoxin domain-containing protein, partial [Candidatus Andersenbacteria bacterium]|nr:cupredoxin domain-containing protein [Candidatus Andersenbacteria bacterium]